MNNPEYSSLLRDPQWRKRRLEIIARDKSTCRRCGETQGSLEVHHLAYVFGLEPWNYEDHWLVTLCGDCHKFVTRPDVRIALSLIPIQNIRWIPPQAAQETETRERMSPETLAERFAEMRKAVQ